MNDTVYTGNWSEFNGPNDQINGTHRWQVVLLDVVEQYYAQPSGQILLTAALLREAKDLLTPARGPIPEANSTDYLCCSIDHATNERPDSCPARVQMQSILSDVRIDLSGSGFHYLRVHGFDYEDISWLRTDQVARHWVIDRMIEIAKRTGNA